MKKYYFYKNSENKIILAGGAPQILEEIVVEVEDNENFGDALAIVKELVENEKEGK